MSYTACSSRNGFRRQRRARLPSVNCEACAGMRSRCGCTVAELRGPDGSQRRTLAGANAGSARRHARDEPFLRRALRCSTAAISPARHARRRNGQSRPASKYRGVPPELAWSETSISTSSASEAHLLAAGRGGSPTASRTASRPSTPSSIRDSAWRSGHRKLLRFLWQIEETRRLGLEWLYLGYWIAESPKMLLQGRIFFPRNASSTAAGTLSDRALVTLRPPPPLPASRLLGTLSSA